MGVYKYKQSIIVRGDLNMPKGKMAAQVAHASMGAILFYARDMGEVTGTEDKPGHLYQMNVPAPVHEWLSGDFAKIVLKCQTVDDLLALEERAKAQGIPCKLIKDNGTTVFNEPTITCIAVGPWDAEVIDSMTKEFKLL
jgi:PTH2 family peptidyl-tRNA hydrolase